MAKIVPTTYKEMVKNVRAALIRQSELDGNRIMNAITTTGPDLSKIVSSTSSTSFALSDTFMVFECITNKDMHGSTKKDRYGQQFENVMSFDFNIKIYGSGSPAMYQILLSRFRSEEVCEALRSLGVYIYGVTDCDMVNEFINKILWPRCDFTLKIQITTVVDNLETVSNAANIGNIAIESI